MPPSIAPWIASQFGVVVQSVRDLGLRDADDFTIFQAARTANAVVMTKDRDFGEFVMQHGAPPHVVWVRSGNTSNARLRQILNAELPNALAQLAGGASVVEIGVGA